MPRVGIFGDGQLALMLAESLIQKHIPFSVLLQSENSPMERLFPDQVTRDQKKFVSECDVFTLENEFLKKAELEKILGEKGPALFPTLESYHHFADKISQRTFYQELDLPSPGWQVLHTTQETCRISYPLIAKAHSGGYDGKGVRVVKNPEELARVAKDFGLPLLRRIAKARVRAAL